MKKKKLKIILSVIVFLVLVVTIVYSIMYLSVKDVITDLKNVLNERDIVDKTNEEVLENLYMCKDEGTKLDYVDINYLYTIHNFKSGKIIVSYDKECIDGAGGLDFQVELTIKRKNGKWKIEDYSYLTF